MIHIRAVYIPTYGEPPIRHSLYTACETARFFARSIRNVGITNAILFSWLCPCVAIRVSDRNQSTQTVPLHSDLQSSERVRTVVME